MDRLKTVLVGIDFSVCSRAALAQAARLAGRNDADLHVFHVVEPLPSDSAAALTGSEAEFTEMLRLRSEGGMARLREEPGLPADAKLHTFVGPAIERTLDLVASTGADLLVLGTRGSVGRGVGTLATKCVRKVPTKVMLVDEAAGGDPFETVLVCLDFSETSALALEQAVRIAVHDGSRLVAAHVYYGPWHQLHYRAPTPEASPEFRAQYLRELNRNLERALDKHRDVLGTIEVGVELCEHPSYGEGIIELAGEIGADLVVLGTRGRTGLRYVLLGSTAERVLRSLPSSVLTVKPPAFVDPRQALAEE
jgi:nucleotide-binding universal stress UspA family protein